MDAEQFLERVVAPGNYLALAFKSVGRGMGHRFFPRSDTRGAAGFIKWCGKQNIDVWHAMASYTNATLETDAKGRQTYKGERTQLNAQQIKAFWVDLDIKRAGDNKDPSKVYADLGAAVGWIKAFTATTSLPLPNLWVNSGYGLHLYWVVEDPMDTATWQPYAEALKAAVLATGGLADMAVIADSARILRPPESFNLKVPATPAPVKVLSAQTKSDYLNADIYALLQPYLGLVAATPTGPAMPAANPLAGGGPAAAFAGHTSGLNASAQANRAVLKDKSFAQIATKCLQVKHSLATHGNGDPYPLWYLGHLSLAHHTFDGDQFAHEISNGDPRYNQQTVDAAIARVAAEKATKDTGPPQCASYNQHRPGICQGCPFYGRVLSPWNLGAPDGDLPQGYRRHGGAIQRSHMGKEALQWADIVAGDVYGPSLSVTGSGAYSISFTYERAGRRFPVTVAQPEITPEVGNAIGMWGSQGITLDRHEAPFFGDFIVAWIKRLRDQNAERATVVEPYGWAENTDGSIGGFAVGGTLYRPDGSTEQVAGASAVLAESFRVRGDLAKWQRAAEFVTKGRPDLQTLIAAGMGAPLMRFAGEPGLVMNFYSRDSAVGKSSACKVGQTVWASLKTMSSLDDTYNQMRTKIGEAKVMPAYWDELRMDKENSRDTVNLLFAISQGKDKGRLNSDASLKAIGEWQTMLICTGNAPLMDYVVARNGGTDAGAVRLMEFAIDVPPVTLATEAGIVVGECTSAVGQAGKLLAQFYAARAAAVKARVQALMKQLGEDMQSKPNERFYIAGIACTLTAAAIAKQLGLVDFDLPAMQAYIKANWMRLRVDREQLVVNNGEMQIRDLFGEYMVHASPTLLVTTSFPRRGVPSPNYKVVTAPAKTNDPVTMHVGLTDNAIRVNKRHLEDWLRGKSIAPAEVFKAMKVQWGMREDRVILGTGTPYSVGGQIRVVEVGLGHSDFDDYDFSGGITPAQPTAKAPPSKAVAGNQPKV